MENKDNPTFLQVGLTHFVPSFFMGAFLLYMMDGALSLGLIKNLSQTMFGLDDIIMASVTGTLVAGAVAFFHVIRNKKTRALGVQSQISASRRVIAYGAAIGFISGVSDILLLLHSEGIIFLTILVLAILGWNLREFNHRIVTMLKPGNVATWGEVNELMRIYLTMLAGFTLVNATLEGAHLMTGTPAPFGFYSNGGDIFINALYYTVVTMTTLGFGDIVPRTWDGKLLLIIQCLVSYVMFALMVGIVTRGVVRGRDNEDQ